MTRNAATVLLTGATLGLVVILSTPSSARAAASLTPLGDLPGGSVLSVANSVSDDGSTVVGHSSSASGDYEAFRWTKGTGMVGLGDLSGGSFFSIANGVSGDGSVVVGYANSTAGEQAFRWTVAGGMVGLDGMSAHDVSADGSTVVGYRGAVGGGYEAFRWTEGGGMMGLGYLTGGDVGTSFGYAVTGDGSVVVGASYGVSGGYEAFRWTEGGGMVALGTPPDWYAGSFATGVSADGSVIVGSGGFNIDQQQSFRWTGEAGMVGLGYPPTGYDNFGSWTSVGGDGSVVVGGCFVAYGDTGIFEALRWTADSGMERLWDLLLANGVNPAEDGWARLHQATGISTDGNTIVGFGQRNGNAEAFVAVIPEPVALPSMLLGGSALLLLRRRGKELPEV